MRSIGDLNGWVYGWAWDWGWTWTRGWDQKYWRYIDQALDTMTLAKRLT